MADLKPIQRLFVCALPIPRNKPYGFQRICGIRANAFYKKNCRCRESCLRKCQWSLFSRWKNPSTPTGRKSERTHYLAWFFLLTETSHVWGRWISFNVSRETLEFIQSCLWGWLCWRIVKLIQLLGKNSSTPTRRKSERIYLLALSSLLLETSHVWGNWISYSEFLIGRKQAWGCQVGKSNVISRCSINFCRVTGMVSRETWWGWLVRRLAVWECCFFSMSCRGLGWVF